MGRLTKCFILIFILAMISSCEDRKENDTIPPNPVQLYPISYGNNSFYVTWSKNDDQDFHSYQLYESLSDDMSSKSLIYETKAKNDTFYVITGITGFELRYYQVRVIDNSKLDTLSNIVRGDPFNLYVKTFGESDNESGNSIQITSDGGFIIVGTWLIKTDSNGTAEWINKNIGGNSVQQTNDGGFIIIGSKLVKTNSSGNIEWINDNIGGNDINRTDDGGYIIIGSVPDSGVYKVSLIKTDSQGNKDWSQTFYRGIGYEYGYSGHQTKDGGYIIAGTYLIHNRYMLVIKTDSLGTEEWSITLKGSEQSGVTHIEQTTDGGYIVCGLSNFIANVTKIDSTGDIEWSKALYPYSGSSSRANYVQQVKDHGYIIVGHIFGLFGGDVNNYNNWRTRISLTKLDPQGNEEWTKFLGDYNNGSAVQQTGDDGYIIVGMTKPVNNDTDILLIKTDSEGNIVPLGN